MGALTSLTKWIPEDDLMLKNAVEAGASLESLAKGAVQFSRRYTIRELRDRWRSLLYDLDTSIEASARMVEVELELTASNLPKTTRACNPIYKGKESSSGKRKADSVRSHYYAMRKRIRSEPCAVNLNFFEPCALLAATACDSGSKEHLMPDSKHPVDNFCLEVPLPDDYGHPETGYGTAHHAFPELMRVDSTAANGDVSHQACHVGHMDPVEDGIPDGPSAGGCLIAYPENISSVPHDEVECSKGNQSFERNFQLRDFPNILGDNLIDTSSEIHEIGQSNVLGTSSLYKDEDIGAKPLSHFDSSNNNHEGFCADFVQNDNLSPHVPEYGGSFHQTSGYSSPPSGVHAWRTMKDNSTPRMPVEGHYTENTPGLLHMDDHKNIDAAGCDITSSEPKLDDAMCGAGLNNTAMTPENDFMDFPDTYMDFDDEENLLFMDVDEKDGTDRPCLGLSSILLNSPDDTHNAIASSNDVGQTNASEACLKIHDADCPGEPKVLCDEMHSQHPDDHNESVSDVNVPSTSSLPSNTIDLRTEFMICVVNTEDPEIPNNDHVIFPDPQSSSDMKQSIREVTGLVSADIILSTDGKNTVGCSKSNKVEDQVANLQSTVSSLKVSSLGLPEAAVLHSCDGCALGAEPSKDSMIGCPQYAGNDIDEAKLCRSETGVNSMPATAFKEESAAPCFHSQDNPDNSFASFLESHLQEADDAKVHPLDVTVSFPEETNLQVAIQTCLPPQPDMAAEVVFSDAVVMVSTSDQEEQFADSEDEVPHFSDIEALILDMDLGPYDEESFLFSKEDSRYQHIDTKSTVRLEQGFKSHINRSISFHGAFAVFYGRHLKYFIKDPEVLIGRETEDEKVDIDLGREGRANKISRRQAIIKMDENGSFSLRNIGKFPIFVNGKEVLAKKSKELPSQSLVKIQDMHFAFEVNQKAVTCYIMKMHNNCQEAGSFRFDWKPECNP